MDIQRPASVAQAKKRKQSIIGVIAVLAVAGVQIALVTRRLLPPEIRPPLWRTAALVACSLFYGAIFAIVVWSLVR